MEVSGSVLMNGVLSVSDTELFSIVSFPLALCYINIWRVEYHSSFSKQLKGRLHLIFPTKRQNGVWAVPAKELENLCVEWI